MSSKYQAMAEQFLRGLYTGDTSIVENMAAEEIVISYPIFKKIYGTYSICGREAVKNFSIRFAKRFIEGQVTMHESIAERNCVIIVWSFRARDTASAEQNSGSDDFQSWGGITLYRFDDSGKIVLEVGEESEPGPFGRLERTDKQH